MTGYSPVALDDECRVASTMFPESPRFSLVMEYDQQSRRGLVL